jgi:TRAP transporter 4TM/12TM fusion protein
MAKEERRLKGARSWIVMIFFVVALLFAINQIFDIEFFVGYVLIQPTYIFLIGGLLIPLVFFNVSAGEKRRFAWLDWLFLLLYCGLSLFLAWNGYDILTKGYGYMAPPQFVVVSLILWALLLEGIRRSAGMVYMVVVLFFSIYPLFASYMPGLLEGVQRSVFQTAVFHMLSTESAMGTLAGIFTNIVFGFIVFGIAVVATGGDTFLLNLAYNVVGKTRGGPAKMSVIASALFGSLSGSSIANVLTIGSITIPAMKSCGYSPEYAGAIESCTSTAGTLTPPIMGATAFVMASILDVSYTHVALAAAIPAFLFYVALFVQVDGQAARMNLRGLGEKDVLPLRQVLLDGWFYLPAVMVLVYFLFFLRWEGESAYVASAVMLILAQFRKKTRFTLKSFLVFLEDGGISSATLFAIMTGAGMLMGSFSLTGIASTFSRALFILAGGNTALMLIFTAIASLILGMGMTVIACYIFLALIVAPALVQAGLNQLAVHMFVLYCGMLSFITPPVALCAFAAATIAKVSPMRIGITAVRLGGAIFLLPFFFVLNPVLVLQGAAPQILYALFTACAGMFLLGSALEGYMIFLGDFHFMTGYLIRVAFFIAGITLALPGWKSDLIGFLIAAVTIGIILLVRPRRLTLGKL